MATEEDNFDIDIYGDGGEDYQQDNPEPISSENHPESGSHGAEAPYPRDELSNQAHASTNGFDGQQDLKTGTDPTQHSDVAQKIASTDDSTHDPLHLPKQAPQTQGLKRKEGDDDRFLDPAATTALFISDLHWWVTDDDIRGWANQNQCEDELEDVTFSEHKVNGKSKGQAYVLFKSPQAATATKQKIESFGEGQQFSKKFTVSYTNPFTNPFRTLPKDGPMRNNGGNHRSGQGFNSSGSMPPQQMGYNSYRGNRGGGYNNRGGMNGMSNYNRGGFQQARGGGFQASPMGSFQGMGGMQPYGGFQNRGGMIGGMRGSPMGASANWVILRQIYAAIKLPSPTAEDGMKDVTVILVSWLRGLEFWKDGVRRLGLNFTTNGKIAFIDALQSGLGLHSAGIDEAEKTLLKSIEVAKAAGSRILLVLDGIDVLLAAAEATINKILDLIWELREVCRTFLRWENRSILRKALRTLKVNQRAHATIVSASADFPLLQVQNTPLEVNHAAFAMSMAHQARAIWAVRELDTGSAKDVSGVLRITRGPAIEDREESKANEVEEKELLYFVAGDGGVRVFEKGSS
ncbi:MAG: hypothetical protein Q9181_001584 [Wetmoreana brouardii]